MSAGSVITIPAKFNESKQGWEQSKLTPGQPILQASGDGWACWSVTAQLAHRLRVCPRGTRLPGAAGPTGDKYMEKDI